MTRHLDHGQSPTGLKIRLRLFVEHLPEGRVAASVLHLPPADDPGVLSLLFGIGDDEPARGAGRIGASLGSALPSPRLAALAEGVPEASARLAELVRRRVADLGPGRIAGLFPFFPDEALDRADARVSPVGHDEKELPSAPVSFALVLTRMPRPPHRVTVPKLGIVLAVADLADARAAAEVEIAAVLKRERALRRLERIHELFPALDEELAVLEVDDAPVMTPLDAIELSRKDAKAVGERRAKADQEELDSVATDLGKRAREGKLHAAHEHEDAVRECLEFLRGSTERAIALVGPSGAGKTAALHEAVRRLQPLADAPPVYHVTGAEIIAGMSMLGAWQERVRAIVEACAKTRAVLCVGDPHELIDGGPSNRSRTTIAQVLKRPLEEGKVRLLAECTVEAWEALERRDRGFAGLFRAVRVPEPERPRTLAIAARAALEIHRQGRARVGEDALASLVELERRFAPYAAFPGKAIRFLRRLARELPADPERRFGRADMVRAYAAQTGLPEALLSDEIALDPDEVRARLRRRIVGQEGAVHAVAALLSRVKAGVADPSRPLGSFLFLGPTGVGKTETAKALAALLFGSEKRLVRIDMSEYQDGRAAARLVGGARGDGEGELVRRVRAEPLSVLLLDEIEKADPGVFDLLLQVLGEARLTDAKGRTTDFRSAIVVLTSNLGAEEPDGAIGFGGSSGAADEAAAAAASEKFVRAAEGFFRPELVARLDAIIPFRPLPREAIRRIAHREVERALLRDGLSRRGITATADASIVERAIDAGFHPKYGARPLKRAIERLVVAPLATALAARSPAPKRMRVALDGEGRPSVAFDSTLESASGPLLTLSGGDAGAAHARVSAEELMRRIAVLRRAAVDLSRDDATLDARDEVETLEAQRRRESGRRRARDVPAPDRGEETPPRPLRLKAPVPRFDASPDGARLRRLSGALDEAAKARKAAEELEDLAALAFVEGDHASLEGLAPEVGRVSKLVDAASFAVRALRFDPANAIAILIAGIDKSQGGGGKSLALELAHLYAAHAKAHDLDVYAQVERRAAERPRGAVSWSPVLEDRPRGAGVGWVAADCPPKEAGEGGTIGLLIVGRDAVARFIGEGGRHRLVPGKQGLPERTALVRCLAVGNPAAPEATLLRLRTLKLPSEKLAPGIPASIPEVVRVYDERGAPPAVRDPRSSHSIAFRFPEAMAGAPLDGFAAAFLASPQGAHAASASNAEAAHDRPGGAGGAGGAGPPGGVS